MTEITCRLCNESISFNIEDKESYLHKSETGNPIIGKLYTIRVGHQYKRGLIHINVVVIDEKGEYRAHKDYYEEKELKQKSFDKWERFLHQIPIEIRSYLTLANDNEKRTLSSITEPLNKSPTELYYNLARLKLENPFSQLLSFLAVKWGFIIGTGKSLLQENYLSNSWSYPIYLRLQARFSPKPELVEIIKGLDFSSAPALMQLEVAIAKAEIYLRLSEYNLLEELYNESLKNWGHETSIEMKSGWMLIQGYYGFGFYFLGNINKAIKLIEPAFNFGQIIENREIINVVGNFYAAVLQSSGELEKTLQTYHIVLNVSEDMGDERTKAVISSNMSVVESKQGLYDQALERQRAILELPIVKDEYFLKMSLQSIIAETLFIAEHYEESIDLCKTLIFDRNMPTNYKFDTLSTLKKIAGKTDSPELLEFVKNHLIDDKEFLESPVNKIFNYDLKAIDAKLQEKWDELVDLLKKERKIMFSNNLIEDASDIEIRLAEGYFKLYQQFEKLEDLNHAYSHLDLAKMIAFERQNYLDLCRLEILKGLLANESKVTDQAELNLKNALKIAQEHNLQNLEPQIVEQLDQLDKGIIEKSASSFLRKLFNRLSFRKAEEAKPKQEGVVYTIFVANQDSTWKLVLQNEKVGSSEYTHYLLGFRDLWEQLRRTDINQPKNYFNTEKGAVLIENSPNFQLITLCDQLDYLTRLTLQNILPTLEEFSFKYIPEELSQKVLELINTNITKFIKVD
ncbi:MAG: hypothetical protein ACFFFB_01610 [Candidatus Heimdallarchaeota archaeon]